MKQDDEIIYIDEEPIVIEDEEELTDVINIIEEDNTIDSFNKLEIKSEKLNDEEIVNIDEIEKILDDENTKELVIDYINDSNKNQKATKKKKRKKSSKGWVIIFGILDAIAIICLFLMYGPITYFRNLWVTSAMTTMNHRYLAYIFFNDSTIVNIMENNIIIEPEIEGNTDGINVAGQDTGVYSSIYEEQVLKREDGNDLYKVIDIEGDGYKGHLLVVYDPSRVHLYQHSGLNYGGKQLQQMLTLADAKAGINASGFSVSTVNSETYKYSVSGPVIIDGKVISDSGSTGWGGGIIGFTYDNKLLLTKKSAYEAIEMGVRDGMSFGPFLIVNGEAAAFKGNGGYGIAPRSAIGQRQDGIVLLLVIDGRRPGHSLGVDMVELTNIMLKYGAYNASNLDGGGSSSMVVDGEVLSVAGGSGYSGERYLPNAWVVK